MRRIEIWLTAEDAAAARTPDTRLPALIEALGAAGLEVRLRHLAAAPVAGALVWQNLDAPLERARALAGGVGEIVGPWMHPAEALARSLRQGRANPLRPIDGTGWMSLGELEIDLIEREARRDGRLLGLLQREYELLCFLARHAGNPQSRETLLRAIWRLSFDPGTNVVEVHVSRLRAKLDRGFPWPMLRTVKGAGYALVVEAERQWRTA